MSNPIYDRKTLPYCVSIARIFEMSTWNSLGFFVILKLLIPVKEWSAGVIGVSCNNGAFKDLKISIHSLVAEHWPSHQIN